MISMLPQGVRLILLNGAEVDLNSTKEPERHLRHRKYNSIVDRVVSRHPNVSLIDVRGIVTDPSNTTNSIRHYRRNVYPILASRVDEILAAEGVPLKENNEGLDEEVKTSTSMTQRGSTAKRLTQRIKKLAQRFAK